MLACLTVVPTTWAQGEVQPESQVSEQSSKNGSSAPQIDAKVESKEPEVSDVDGDQNGKSGLFNGFVLDTLESRLQLRVGAQFLFDYANVSNNGGLASAFGDDASLSEVRDAIFEFSGRFFLKTNFRFQLEIESGDIDLGDMYIERDEIPHIGSLRVGHFVEPFSLERVTSLRYSTFMERSLASAFAPGKSAGVMASDTRMNDRLTWAVGIFKSTNTVDSVADTDSLNISARLTGLPVFADEGRRLVHLGLSFHHSESGDEFGFKPRSESFLAPRYLDTGTLDIDAANTLNGEAAAVWGPFSVQSEYTLVWMDNVELLALPGGPVAAGGRDDVFFHGGYLQASYFLTGEHRTYNHRKGAFGRTYPSQIFGLKKGKRGPGAWQLAAQVSRIDLNDGPIRGGRQTNYSLGLNWYLNKGIRIAFNYIHADVHRDLSSGDADILQARFQIDFSPKEIGERRPLSVFRSRTSSGI